jgi:hypothetical protein
VWFRRKTLPEVLAGRIEPQDGDLTIELTMWLAEHDTAVDLEVWRLAVEVDRADDREPAAH